MKNFYQQFCAALFLLVLFASDALACACGCGVFNVGTSALIPNRQGGTAFLQYDYMDQAQNWSKTKDSNGHNHDRRINTQTVTAGTQYMFNREWGAAIRIPYVTRYVQTLPHHSGMSYSRHSDVGDIRVNGIYSGFFSDMSTGITFGLKLPTGSSSVKTFSRTTQIGTGSTDTILGAYHMGQVDEAGKFNYFAQASWEHPAIIHRGYHPGDEVSGASGIYYNAGSFFGLKKVAPIAQVTGSKKTQDSGWATYDHNLSSGYTQIFFAPGIELSFNDFKLYADVEFPIYRNVNGNQLVPQNLYKMILGYNF